MDEFTREVNNLLAFLRSFQVVSLIGKYYREWGNSAPPELLKEQMETVQKLLDQLTKGGKDNAN